MYCRVIACDFDGTGATDGHPAPELYAALAAARAQGIVTLLVTGRVLEDVQRACEELSPFDAVVAENGAIIYLCALGRMIQLGEPPPKHFLGELRAQGVPFHTGAVIVGTWEQHAGTLLNLIRRFGIDGQLIFNRAALMLLPSGINKAVGLRRALDELGRSERNMVAFGDAENDIPLLIGAEVGVAARASTPAVLALADDRVSQPGGAGVAQFIRRLIEGSGILPNPPRRVVTLGKDQTGAAVNLPSAGINLMVSGDPRSGKSWVVGLLAEQLIEAGYRLCIIDPEGDYGQAAQPNHYLRQRSRAAGANNMNEFYRAIQAAPSGSLRHHLIAGDFSRWVDDVIGDQQLARGLRKLERTIPAGTLPDRAEILAHIADH